MSHNISDAVKPDTVRSPDPAIRRAREVRGMFGSIAPTYDLVNTVLSGGVHLLWRKVLVNGVDNAARGARVLDLCSGTGALIPLLQKKGYRVTAADFCGPMLEQSRMRHRDVPHLQGDALQLALPDNTFDLVTVAFGVRNFEELHAGLVEIRRVLKPGGKVHILEFGQPAGALFKQIFYFYSNRIMPVVGGLLSGNRHAYKYLPETSAAFPCGEDFKQKLSKSGFQDTSASSLTGGIAYIYRAVAE